jgi:hypothetical protein
MKVPRVPYRAGQGLIVLLAAGTVVSDSMSPFLSMSLDGMCALLIIVVVIRLSK